MPDPIISLGKVLSRDMAQMAVHAENIANTNTSGFRRQVFATDAAGATRSAVDTQGSLRATGRPLDVAVIGDGWLVERDTADNIFLTRNGQLRIAADGYLVSATGNRLQGVGGPVLAGPAATHVVQTDGTVLADGQVAGQLLVVATPTDTARRLPDGRWQVADMPSATPTRLAPGVLEYANVDIGVEMAGLMMAGRHLESTQRALQIYDNVLNTGIGQIGKE